MFMNVHLPSISSRNLDVVHEAAESIREENVLQWEVGGL